MENKVLWHYRSPNKRELKDALKDLKMRDRFIANLVNYLKK